MKSDRTVLIIILVCALFGAGLLAFSTVKGAGVGGDATIYMTSARHLVEGKGLGLFTPDGTFRLLPYFPPFYPLILSVFALLGLDLAIAARWLNILLFAGVVFLIGWQTLQSIPAGGKGRRGLAILASLLVAVSPVLLPVYSWAMSEPLAIFLGFLGISLVLLAAKVDRGGVIVLAGLIAGLGILTRYGNLAFALAGMVLLFFGKNNMLRKRIQDAAVYAFFAALPAAVWVVYDVIQTSALSSRSVESGAGMASRIAALFPALGDVFLFWWIPDSWITNPPYPAILNLAILVGLLALVAGWYVFLTIKNQGEATRTLGLKQLTGLLAAFLVLYVLVIGTVYITTYPPITIASRMLAPAHIAFVWLIVLLAAWTLNAGLQSRRMPASVLPLVLGAALVILSGWYGWRTLRIVQQNAELGLGYNSVEWQASPTLAAVKALPEDQLVVSNEEMAVLYLTGRVSYPLAEIYANQPMDEFTAYGESIPDGDEAQAKFASGDAVLVIFDSLETQLTGIYGEQTAERLEMLTSGLEPVTVQEDGAIYRMPGK